MWSDPIISAFEERVAGLPDDTLLPTPPLPGTAEAALTWALAQSRDQLVLWIGHGRDRLEHMHRDLLSLRPQAVEQLLYFPPWDSTTDTDVIPDAELAGQRMTVLTRLADPAETGPRILVTCIQALMQRTPTPDHTGTATHVLTPGTPRDPAQLAEQLQHSGYRFESVVDARGQAARRGGLLDIWPLNSAWPVRIEFVGDDIESLRTFDPASQRSVEHLDTIAICPAAETELTGCVLDYVPDDRVTVRSNPDDIAHHAKRMWTAAQESGSTEAVLSADDIEAQLATHAEGLQVHIADLSTPPEQQFFADVTPLPDLFDGRTDALQPDLIAKGRQRLFDHLTACVEAKHTVCVAVDTAGAAEHFQDAAATGLGASPESLGITVAVGTLSSGFTSATMRITLATQPDLYGRHKREGRRYDPATRTRRPASGSRVGNVTDIEAGDLVVHVEHGIGRYEGLSRITFNGALQEVLTIEYADNARLHVPVNQAHLLTRYVGSDRADAPLHRLGGKRWNKDKDAAARAVADLAASLLETQAHRSSQHGHACGPDVPWQHEFEAAFPYRETRDQHEVIAAVKRDMETARPMDRLICGDAGYGKTEVAMRAAFKAVMYQKQVAVLVPTTVLAQQHYDTFATRMADYPVRIEVLSRFRGTTQRRATLQGLADGTVDIVIGTHALLQPGITFRDLGLVIIDEEQRFGVKHKEAFKQLRRMVDVLTLTATPIPRTLYMSMTGARDLSLLQTPPLERVPIETHVTRSSERVIREAILREIDREGQVFYLHNRVMTIEAVCEQLRERVPEARFEYAHGQMAAGELAEVMRRFINGECDVLVSTTIVESGVDIPRANTILIDRADRFGISDLYQLRGRVGRSSRKAYAYLLLPPTGRVDSDARRRVDALRKYSGLSAGFSLALRDLEIRGAGNMLGAAQSGHISAIGFGLYCQLLRRTVAQLKGEPLPRIVDVEVAIDFLNLAPPRAAADAPLNAAACGIPEDYIEDEGLRVQMYRKLAEAATDQDLASLDEELHDRFGPAPPATRRMLRVAGLRLRCADAGLTRLETRDTKVVLSRGNDPLTQHGRFPRLQARTPDDRLDEIEALVQSCSVWSEKKRVR